MVAIFGYIVLVFNGGMGSYEFEFVINGLGAILNELSGAYFFGDVVDIVDLVRVIDVGCVDVVEVTILVVSDFLVNLVNVVILFKSCFVL